MNRVDRDIPHLVDAQRFCALDGTTDDAVGFLAALTLAGTGGEVFIPGGKTMLLQSTVSVAVDRLKLTGGPGAIIKIGASPTGTMSTKLRFLSLVSRTGVVIEGIKFQGPASPLSTLGSESGPVYLQDCVDCVVRNCEFALTSHSSTSAYAAAVHVRGTSSERNVIEGNVITGAQIQYTYAGASRTRVANNRIISSPTNGMSGTGNAGTPSDCQVIDNYIYQPARMGIEEAGGIVYRSIIRGNIVIGDGNVRANGMGISATGSQTLVEGNTVIDFEDYGIESGGRGVRVIGNSLRQIASAVAQAGTGIAINGGSADPIGGATVQGNYIEGYFTGVNILTASGPVSVNGNVLVNCQGAIGGDTTSAYAALVISNNVIRYTAPNNYAGSQIRVGIRLFSTAAASNFGARVIGNHIAWETTAAAGSSTGIETAIKVSADDALVLGNVVDANGITGSGTSAPYGFNGAGSTNTGVVVAFNVFRGGALVSVSNYVTPSYFMNSKVPDAGSALIGFFNVTPVAKPAALTAANGSALNTGDATSDTVIGNMRTRIGELETKLQSLGLLS